MTDEQRTQATELVNAQKFVYLRRADRTALLRELSVIQLNARSFRLWTRHQSAELADRTRDYYRRAQKAVDREIARQEAGRA